MPLSFWLAHFITAFSTLSPGPNLWEHYRECIRHKYGGRWAEHDGHYAIEFDDRNAVFPFSKVAKQFENGQEDSIESLFTLIPLVFKLDKR